MQSYFRISVANDRNVYENIAFALRVTETPSRVIKRKVPAALSLEVLRRNISLIRKNFPAESSRIVDRPCDRE